MNIVKKIDFFFMIFSLVMGPFVIYSIYKNYTYWDSMLNYLFFIASSLLLLLMVISLFLLYRKKRYLGYLLYAFACMFYSFLIILTTTYYYSIGMLTFVLSLAMVYINIGIKNKIKSFILVINLIVYLSIAFLQTLMVLPTYQDEIDNSIISFILHFIIILGIYRCIQIIIYLRKI